MITDGQARRIAAEWHSGQKSLLCSLATSGFVSSDTAREVQLEVDHILRVRHDLHITGPDQELRDLSALLEYVVEVGDRYAVPGWHDLWDDAPV